MPDFLMQGAASFLTSLHNGAPWILLSFVLAAFFREAMAIGWAKRRLGRKGLMPVIYGSFSGLVTPA